VFFAAIVSSGVQLASGAQLALGSSGIVFALLGWMLATWRRVPLFRLFLTRRMRLFLAGWFIISFVIAALGVWPAGNAANLGGLLFGLAVGWFFYGRPIFKIPAAGAMGTLAALSVLAVLWVPWSPHWPLWQFTEAHAGGDEAACRRIAEGALRSRPDEVWALNGLAWVLATADDGELRDGARAIAMARRACAVSCWREASVIDTLAAAYAETGQWDKAERMEMEALKLHDTKPGTTLESSHARSELEKNLTLIRRRQPIRD
jgi:hypothetical protein